MTLKRDNSLLRLIGTFRRASALEWRYISTQKWDQAMLIWVPLASLLLLWWTFSSEQVHNVHIAVVDQDRSTYSRALLRDINASPNLEVYEQYDSLEEARATLHQRKTYAVLIIPNDFSARISRLQTAPIQAIVNAQYGTHSGIIATGLKKVAGTFSVKQKARVLVGLGKPFAMVESSPQMMSGDVRVLFNQSSNYRLFIAAGIIPTLLHILATIAGAYAFGRELRDSSLHKNMRNSRMPVLSSPHQRRSLSFLSITAMLHGKLIWPMVSYLILGALGLSLITIDQPVSIANWWLCLFNIALLIAISLWLGVLLSASTMSLRVGLSATAMITAPSFAFSGVTFPVSAMPHGAQVLSSLLPLTHYLDTQIALLIQRVPSNSVAFNTIGFIVATFTLMFLATRLSTKALNRPERWGAR